MASDRTTNYAGQPRTLRPRGAAPLMSREELLKRLDGRAYRAVEIEIGAPSGQVSRWAGQQPIPDKWVPIIRARYPLPDEDRYEEGRQMGYRQALSDVGMKMRDLKP